MKTTRNQIYGSDPGQTAYISATEIRVIRAVSYAAARQKTQNIFYQSAYTQKKQEERVHIYKGHEGRVIEKPL